MVSKVCDGNLTSVKLIFFFSVESPTLTKMDPLTTIQRIKIIKTYYKNVYSATDTYRALKGDYSLHNRPTTQAIGKFSGDWSGDKY